MSELAGNKYMIASYICRKGVRGDDPEFTKYNPIVDGIMA